MRVNWTCFIAGLLACQLGQADEFQIGDRHFTLPAGFTLSTGEELVGLDSGFATAAAVGNFAEGIALRLLRTPSMSTLVGGEQRSGCWWIVGMAGMLV